MKSIFMLTQAIDKLQNMIKQEAKKITTNENNIADHDKAIKDLNKEIKDSTKDLENKIENIQLKEPVNGKDGKDGLNGKDGKDGKNGIDGKNGRDGKDGKDGVNGKDGKDGKNGADGKDGINGKDGIGIRKTQVNDEGDLIILLTDNTMINAGHVKGAGGTNGYNGRDGADGISVTNAEIKESHLIITLSDGTEIDAGHISGGGGSGVDSYLDLNDKPSLNNVTIEGDMTLHELGIQPEGNYAEESDIPTTLAELSDDTTHRVVTDTEKEMWNSKSNFSGSYNDLTDKPDIPVIPEIPSKTSDLTNDSGFITKDVDNLTKYTKTSDLPTKVSAFANDVGYLTEHQDISGKYDKTGGEITGNVKIDGSLTLDIEDEDYDAGITLTKALDNNLGTVLTLNGYANGQENTNYKPIIRNIGTPQASYDVANKKYVDDNVVQPTLHLVFLNPDGTVDTYASTLNYNRIKANMTDPKEADYLDVVWGNSRFYAKCIEVTDVNNGDLKFITDIEYAGIARRMVFTLNSNNVLITTSITTGEIVSNKTNDIVSNSASTEKYPSTYAVFEQFQRKPVVVWETDTNFLAAIQADISENPAWQLTGLDLTPYKRVKIYSKAGKGRTTASATPAMVLEMSLDTIAGSTDYGGNFIGSVLVQKPNDNNRLATLTCAISADKTKFVVLRQTSLYGTAATTNADIGADVYKIEGYFD